MLNVRSIGGGEMKKEIIKQLYEQPLHVLMGILSVCFFAWAFKGQVWVAVGITAAWEGYREYLQWPSDRFWDLPLDATFEILGIIAGYFTWTLWLSNIV